ncbi:SRPBCC family protein [Streptomyces sp. NPDC096132]|uniref:SRPBCC family protein n=1 Tax=Streptomyces sp. NPDC096132 TaxID=3366075 RepID=UPI003829C70B
MATIVQEVPVNKPGQAPLSREDVWGALEIKARNAPRFVKAIDTCVVLEEGDNWLTREITGMGERHIERVTFTPQRVVRFDRSEGNTTGYITNEIQDTDSGLVLRFRIELTRNDLEAGSEEERAYFEGIRAAYVDAVESTLEATRVLLSDVKKTG